MRNASRIVSLACCSLSVEQLNYLCHCCSPAGRWAGHLPKSPMLYIKFNAAVIYILILDCYLLLHSTVYMTVNVSCNTGPD